MVSFFKEHPNSTESNTKITSPQSQLYNCIAWAAGTQLYYIWPDEYNQFGWPPNIPREETIEAFIKFFALIGYKRCTSSLLEAGIEKVAIYAKNGIPTHAARQLSSGLWASKLGVLVDIEHEIYAVTEGSYGSLACILSRKRSKFPPPLPILHPPPGLVNASGIPLRK